MNLLIILAVLGICLFLLVTVGERVLKPMPEARLSKLGSVLMFLIMLLIVVRLFDHYVMG